MLLAFFALGFAVSCGAPEGEKPMEEKLVLVPAKLTFSADGVDEVHFTVTRGGVDVTAEAQVCQTGKSCLTRPVFTTETPGDYEFYASLTNDTTVKSDPVTITAITIDEPEPDKAFRKNVTFFTFTGTWCAPCYTFKNTMKEVMEERGDEVVSVNFYMTSDAEVDLAEQNDYYDQMTGAGFDLGNIPASFVDLDTPLMDDEGQPSLEEIEATLATSAATPAPVGIRVDSEKSGPYINVEAEVFASVAGEYRIGILLVEDDIDARQMNDTTGYEEHYNHTNVLRTVAAGDVFGAPAVAIAEGEASTATHRFTVSSQMNAKNLSIVVYVLRYAADRWIIVNSVKATSTGLTDYRYVE